MMRDDNFDRLSGSIGIGGGLYSCSGSSDSFDWRKNDLEDGAESDSILSKNARAYRNVNSDSR